MTPAPAVERPGARFADYTAIALVSAAVLLYEIAITRVLSVVLWYHFAFLAVSLAMLGLGLPGVWLTLRRPDRAALPVALLASAVVVPSSVAALFQVSKIAPVRGALPTLDVLVNPGMLLVLACVLAPFLCLGTAVCLLLMRAPGQRVGRMYAADLLGATVAAAAVVPLMHAVPTPLIVAGAGLLPLCAAALVPGRQRALAPVAGVGLIAALAWGEPFEVRAVKAYDEPEDVLYTEWTPTARLVVFPNVFYVKDPEAGFGWGMGSEYEPEPIEQLWIEQDGSAGTPITHLERTPRDLSHLLFDVTSLGYQLRPPERVCIIGAGGGRDVLTALRAGASSVDAVELNGHIVDIVSERFSEFSGDVYHLDGVRPIVSEGRSFLTRARDEYDLIQVSLIDSWAATAAGAFSLSENYLYTVESLRLYLTRAADEGVVSISRWIGGHRQMESARLAAMIRRALTLEGAREPHRHLYVARAWDVATFLVSPTPFSEAEIRRLDEVSEKRGFRRYWPLGNGSPEDSTVASVLTGSVDTWQDKGFDLSPATDDRPFFFQTISLFADLDRNELARLSSNEHSVSLLRVLLGVVSAATLILFLLPFAFRRRAVVSKELWMGSGYFLCIGLGFMLVEMPLMQRFVLYLGHPSYATTVVLATLLVGAGLGSLAAARLPPNRLAAWGWLLPAALIGANFLLAPMFETTLGWSFSARVAASIVLLVPAGFLMGFAFPLGMSIFPERGKPWFWAVNGVASVLATVFSLALAMVAGFYWTALLGALFYAIAVGLIIFELRSTGRRVANAAA